jgi:endonuclease/exonuclease/phosphatase family metal-dependent hydrolase
LFNYLEPPNAFYEFERIYSKVQWQKKQRWIGDYLQTYQPDIIGFQEVFSIDSLKALLQAKGFQFFSVIDKPEVIDDFIYKSPVVALASRYPIVETETITPDISLARSLGLSKDFSFSRKVLRATIDIPHLGYCDCYVVHFKSKRPMIEFDEKHQNLSPEKLIIEQFKAQVAGSWGSTIQRGSEATLLMMDMIARREKTQYPMVLMGDYNNNLTDGVLSHLLTSSLRFVSQIESKLYLQKYCLNDAWHLFQKVLINETNASDNTEQINIQTPIIPTERAATHYFSGSGSVLDYVLLSSEFDAGYDNSLYEVSDYHVYDRHLINPIFDRDGESTDHAVISVTLSLRD